jgi:alpha-L-fucosidase
MTMKSITSACLTLLIAAWACPLLTAGQEGGQSVLPKYVAHPDAPAAYGAIPTEQQVSWQRLEFYGFVHFGINTFTGRQWGYGDEDPALFNPTHFDAEAIARTFKESGMTGLIYTAKHHDGFCAWPTQTTAHNITKTPWKGGKGDVVKEFADACRKVDIHFGTYLSPWDRNHAEYGREGYIRDYYRQIEELLTRYGPVFEIWFDGANGGDGYYGGSRERRKLARQDAADYYNFGQLVKNIRALQPQCIIWGAGHHGDARWGGSEQGHVGYPHWHTLDSQLGRGYATGHRNGDRWVPAEGDTPINHAGWFWVEGQSSRVKSPEELLRVWFECVGRGANLLLNVAPDKTGRLDPADVKSLMEFKRLRDRLYAIDYARDAMASPSNVRKGNDSAFGARHLFDGDPDTYWASDDGVHTPSVEITLREKATFDVVRLREQIRLGQRVEGWAVDVKISGEWKEVVSGTSIGNQVMLKLAEPVTTDALRLRITQSPACPAISEFSLLRQPLVIHPPVITRDPMGMITLSTKGKVPIHFTVDGGDPDAKSPLYREPFALPKGGVVRAAALVDGELSGVAVATFGISKAKWSVHGQTNAAFDENPATAWRTSKPNPQSLVIDLGEVVAARGFTYMPHVAGGFKGMTSRYLVEFSEDGTGWRKVAEGEFGNLLASPVEQVVQFGQQESGRFLRFTSTASLKGNGASVAEIGLIPW